jgi:hypothetical protein
MKGWFCGKEAVAVSMGGKAVCREHANIIDRICFAKSDASTGYATYEWVNNVVLAPDEWIEWESWEGGKKVVRT